MFPERKCLLAHVHRPEALGRAGRTHGVCRCSWGDSIGGHLQVALPLSQNRSLTHTSIFISGGTQDKHLNGVSYHCWSGRSLFRTGFPWLFSPCWIHKKYPCGSEDETSPSPPVLLFLKQVFGLAFAHISVSHGSVNSLLTDLASKHRNEFSRNSGGQKFKIRIAGLESGCHRSVLLRRLRGVSPFDCGPVTPVSASCVSLPPPPRSSVSSYASPISEILKVLLSRVSLFATPWTVAHQAPLSMEFSRQEHWSG